jgi:replicative DNA helicase
MTNKKLPASEDSEAILLGKALNSINVVNDLMDSLESKNFFSDKHRAIFDCMRDLYLKDHAIEVASVADLMKKNYPKHHEVDYLLQLAQAGWGSEETSYHLEHVKESFKLRSMVEIFHANMNSCLEKDNSSEAVYEDLQANLDKLLNSDKNDNYQSLEEVFGSGWGKEDFSFMEYVEKQQERFQSGETDIIKGFRTGFDQLDQALSGLNDGHFIIIAASSGVGKTTMTANLVMRMLNLDLEVGFFSLEMTPTEFATKLIGIHTFIDDRRIDSGRVTPDEYQRLLEAENFLKKKKLFIEPNGNPRISQIEARARRMVESNGVKILFIDYFGKIIPDGKSGSRQEGMQQVSQRLCAIAKKLKIPIVCLCQLNRDFQKDQTGKKRAPRKSDLRESGQLEADAHSIMILNKPDKIDPYDKPGILEVYLVKNRFGPETRIDYQFQEGTGFMKELPKFTINLPDNKKDFYAAD